MTAKSLVFFLKAESVGADLMLYGMEFHIFAPVKENLFLLENSVLNLGRERDFFRKNDIGHASCYLTSSTTVYF